jgi:hypothetical protein
MCRVLRKVASTCALDEYVMHNWVVAIYILVLVCDKLRDKIIINTNSLFS